MSDLKKLLRDYINDYCIVRCPPGYYLKASIDGHAYTWQFYLRNAIFNQTALYCITKLLLDKTKDGVQYAAMESAGPPILSSMSIVKMSMGSELNTFAIRKEQKKYGLLNWFEGYVVPDMPVVIVDDISNSKSTIGRAANILKHHGLHVAGALSIVDKKGSNDVEGIPVDSIFSVDDFQLGWDDYTGPNRMTVEQFVDTYKHALYKKVADGVLEPIGNAPTGWGTKPVDNTKELL